MNATPLRREPPKLRLGRLIEAPNSHSVFRVGRELGAGGFGRVYVARVEGGRGPHFGPGREVCLKVTRDVLSWVREVYFGLLLRGEERAIQVFDFFPLLRRTGHADYCLVIEYAPGGSLYAHLERHPEPWSERRVCREVLGLLRILDMLHERKGLHRDVTPLNVFVCHGGRLKLGDFGIAAQARRGDGVPARTMAPWMAPPEKLEVGTRQWHPRDDLYQVGQLLGMLLRGDPSARLAPADVRALRCSDRLKEVIQRCIGKASDRYRDAAHLIRALERPPEVRYAQVRSLQNCVVVFTGRLGMPRIKAARLARRAGAIVREKLSMNTDVLVRGEPGPNQNAGTRGTKLIRLGALRSRGRRIKLIDEARFLRLVHY